MAKWNSSSHEYIEAIPGLTALNMCKAAPGLGRGF